MSDRIFELVIHARAGQGAKSAAQFFAEAALSKGKWIQAWPTYGAERSGAPMMSFARISDNELRTHEPIVHADAMLVLDPTLLAGADAVNSIKKQGLLIVNGCSEEEARKKTRFSGKIIAIDGTEISIRILGRDFPNIPLLGALVGATGIMELSTISGMIKKKFAHKLGEAMANKNIEALKEGYEKATNKN